MPLGKKLYRLQLNLFKGILKELEDAAASDGPEAQDLFAAFEQQKEHVSLRSLDRVEPQVIGSIQTATPAMSSSEPLLTPVATQVSVFDSTMHESDGSCVRVSLWL